VGARVDVGAGPAAGQSGAARADRPGAGALAVEDLLGDGDLLVAGGEVGARRVGPAAVRLPGGLGELQPAVEPVAGVDVPVAAGLAGGDLFQVSASAAWATPVPMSGRAMPAPPAVTVSEARLILFG
jgi:hypothetical protein